MLATPVTGPTGGLDPDDNAVDADGQTEHPRSDGMLETVRRGVIRGTYEVAEDGHPLATLAQTGKEGCAFTLVGRSYEVERPKRKHFVLTEAGRTLATAEHQSGKRWLLRFSDDSGNTHELMLVRPSWWRSQWELRADGHDTVLGSFRRASAFSRRMLADMPATWGHPIRLFAFYVVIVLWQREQAAAAASSGGGGG